MLLRHTNSWTYSAILLSLIASVNAARESNGSPIGYCPDSCRDCDELGNCLTCHDYKYLQMFDCVDTCGEGFFPEGNQCRECPWECESCLSETVSILLGLKRVI